MRNAPHVFEILRRQIVGTDHGSPIYQHTVTATVQGIFGLLDARELEEWQGQGVTASARVPLSTDVQTTDSVVVKSPEHSAGRWEVSTMRPNPMHLRLMLKC